MRKIKLGNDNLFVTRAIGQSAASGLQSPATGLLLEAFIALLRTATTPLHDDLLIDLDEGESVAGGTRYTGIFLGLHVDTHLSNSGEPRFPKAFIIVRDKAENKVVREIIEVQIVHPMAEAAENA